MEISRVAYIKERRLLDFSQESFRLAQPAGMVRHAVISDWKFFLDNEEWLNYWARRYGESAVRALAEELRRTNWRRLES
jgi:hypothetical protein